MKASSVFIKEFSIPAVSDGGIPVDGTGITTVNTFNLALVIVYYILSAVGVAFTTACLIFNFTQRKKKSVFAKIIPVCLFLTNLLLSIHTIKGDQAYKPKYELLHHFRSIHSLHVNIYSCHSKYRRESKSGKMYCKYNIINV